MDQTARIGLPFIVPEQALKHVTHNAALQVLDALVQLSVKDRDLAAPPGSPAEGDSYIVAAGATGDWAGEDEHVAVFQAAGWAFHAPREGWRAWIEDEDGLVGWDGAAWISAGGGANPTPLVGVNATADTTNRLSVRSNDILFDAVDAGESGDGDCRIKVNKETAGDTASYLFQTGFSGRAEVGLAGDDDFHFKVSPDGSSWFEGIVIDKATGEVSFPNTGFAGLGDVVGPDGGVADGELALFDGTTGKLIEGAGAAAGDAAFKNTGTGAGDVAAGDHLHDDRYYTESELDTALTAKVTGPASAAADGNVPRFDGAGGKLVQDSAVNISDANQLTGHTNMTWTAATEASGQLSFDCLNGAKLAFYDDALGADAEVQLPANLPDGQTMLLRLYPNANTVTWASGYVADVPDFTNPALLAITRDGTDYWVGKVQEAA